MHTRRFSIAAGLVLIAGSAAGQPDLSRKQLMHGILTCPDAKQANTFYYLPNDLAIKESPGGHPELRFVMMRYVGTAAAGDQGKTRYRNILQFDVAMKPRNGDSLALVKRDLQRSHPRLTFGPLPISRVEAVVHYTPAGDTSSTPLGRANLESTSERGEVTSGSYWQERTFTLPVENLTAQIFTQSLRKGMLALSVGYAFLTRGKIEGSPEFSATGTFPSRFRKLMEEVIPKADSADTTLTEGVVHASAFALAIDTAEYDRFVSQVDLNESLPPGYSVLSVYNYDFNNAIRPDLYEKLVEVEAAGAGGGVVRASAEFRSAQPDLYTRSIRFKYAVQLSKPYRYRIRELAQSGEEKIFPWVTIEDWTPILDVTTRTP